MGFWQQLLATAGVMAAILAPFVVIRWVIAERTIREMRRETQQLLREMDDTQREARRLRASVDETRPQNLTDRSLAVDVGKKA